MLTLIFAPFTLFIVFPPAALLFGMFWLGAYGLLKGAFESTGPILRLSVRCSGWAWLVYGLYEGYMWWWSKGVIAPIRVDLLLIAPALYLVTAFAIAGMVVVLILTRREIRTRPE